MYKLKISLLLLTLAACLSACLKDNAYMDVSNTQPIIEFSYGSDGSGDIGNFGVDATMTQLDTAIAVNIASPQVLDYPVTVTLKIDPNLLNKYNAVGGNTQLVMLPDSTFKFTTTTVTIPAGHRLGRIPITLYPSKINPGKSYGLPIAIQDAKGPNGQTLLVSSNSGVAFFAFIGNPLAGPYTYDFTRYNGDTTTAPNSSSFTGASILTTTINPTAILFPESYLQTFADPSAGLAVSFDNNNGTLTNFKVYFDATTTAGLSAGGFTIAQAPIFTNVQLAGNSANNYKGTTFRIYYQLINSSGGVRTFIDKYVKK
jgi:Domain of unknown function (DUF1735)